MLGLPLLVGTARGAAEGEEFDPVHHVSDGYYLDFEPIGKVELPRIFFVRRADGGMGLDVYASTGSALASGRYLVVGGHEQGDTFVEDEAARVTLPDAPSESFDVPEAAAKTGNPIEHAETMVAGAAYLDSELAPADGGHIIIDFSITRHLVFAIIAGLIVVLIFVSLARRYKAGVGRTSAPKGVFQNLFETLILFVRDEIVRPNLGNKADKFLPYLLTAFFFILTSNLLGLVPFGATATSNLMVTAVLATFTFLITQINGSRDHWMHTLWPPGIPTALKPIMIPVEIVGLFTKPIALAIRLFANMTAGHLVILSLIGLIFTFTNLFGNGAGWGVSPVSVAFALFIYLLELLVAFIQAYVFTLLSALFIGMAVEEHHGHDHDLEQYGDLPAGARLQHNADEPDPITGNLSGAAPVQAQPVG